MFVCLCKGVTDTQIKQSVENGANNLHDIRRELGVATQCCKCLPEARLLVEQVLEEQSLEQRDELESAPLYYSA